MTEKITHDCISCQQTFPRSSLLKGPAVQEYNICLCPACGAFIANAAANNQRERGSQLIPDYTFSDTPPTINYPFATNVPLVCHFCKKSSQNVELLLTARLLYEIDKRNLRFTKLYTLGPDLNELNESKHPTLVAAIHICNECASEAAQLSLQQDRD